MKALLIIDMQVGSFGAETPRYDAEGVVRRLNELSEHFRRNGDKVIFIQHEGPDDKTFLKGSDGWNILPSLVRRQGDIVVPKSKNDPFYRTDLEATLKSLGVTQIYITGCATDFCVDATVHAALARDMDIVVVRDCHTTADRPHLPAHKVMEHHEWLWQNMYPTKGRIALVSSKDILPEEHL